MKQDYYEILGVDKGADEAKIKKAYKRLAMKYHPDRNADDKAGSEKKFKEVRKAYDVVSDPQKDQPTTNSVMQELSKVVMALVVEIHLVDLVVALVIFLVIFLVEATQSQITEALTFAMT